MIFTGVKDEINIRYSSTLIKLRIQHSLVFGILQQSTSIVKCYLDLFSCKEYVQLLFFFTQKSSTTSFRYQSHEKNRFFLTIFFSFTCCLFLLCKNWKQNHIIICMYKQERNIKLKKKTLYGVNLLSSELKSD